MKTCHILTLVALTSFATGCAFFDEPMGDIGNATPAQAATIESKPIQTEVAPELPAEIGTLPTPTEIRMTEAGVSPSYLVVAPIERFPRDAKNVAVVHLSDRDTRRELSLCKALMQNMPAVDVQELPENPLTVVVWPVPNDNAGTNCIEMISDYEAIELTPDAAQRVDDDATGPFLLARNLPSDRRMIFDISFKANSALQSTVNQWLSLLGSSPTNWPEYRRAR